jgi:predicted Zn-dependent peptidase
MIHDVRRYRKALWPRRSARWLVLGSILCCFCRLSAAQPLQITLEVSRHQLRNGLNILTLEDHTLPVISYYTFFGVGSRNEPAGRSGLSHLFEHLMFNGARRYGPKEFDRMLESNGGYSNAYTTEDITVYYEDFPSDRLELVVDMESDRMAHLALTEESLASEREVVKEERRVRVDNSVYGHVMEQLAALAYTAHPYRWPVSGWMSDLDAITLEDCRAYFRSHYAPNNAVIVLAGDFNPPEAVELIRRYYERIPAQPPAPPVQTVEPPQYGERRAVVYKFAELPAVAFGYHAPSTKDDDLFPLDVFQMILAHGESARLYRKLVYEEQAAVDVSASFPWMLDPTLFTIYVTIRPDRDPARVEDLVYKEIDRLKTEPVSDQALRKAKNILQAGFVRDLETNSGKADKIGTYEVLFGDWSVMLKALERYEAVTAADIQRVARTYFSDRNRSVLLMKPEERE